MHEGTHAIHGIDIMGRKVRIADGAALKALEAEISDTISLATGHDDLVVYGQDLSDAMLAVQSTLSAAGAAQNPALGLANATIFLDAMGHVVIAWMWLKQAIAAKHGQASNNVKDADFYAGKLAACKFFYKYELPTAIAKFELVSELDDTCFNLNAEQFVGH